MRANKIRIFLGVVWCQTIDIDEIYNFGSLKFWCKPSPSPLKSISKRGKKWKQIFRKKNCLGRYTILLPRQQSRVRWTKIQFAVFLTHSAIFDHVTVDRFIKNSIFMAACNLLPSPFAIGTLCFFIFVTWYIFIYTFISQSF